MRKFLLLLVLTFISIQMHAQNRVHVCYDTDYYCQISSSDSTSRYLWISHIPGADSWDTIYTWDTVTSWLATSIIEEIEVRCIADTNMDSVGDTIIYDVTIHPYAQLEMGDISGGGSICFNTIYSSSFYADSATGGGGVTYQWQQSTSPSGPFSDIFGAVTLSYTVPDVMLTTTYYRLHGVSIAGCGDSYSNIDSLIVFPEVESASIALSDTSAICHNTYSPSIIISDFPAGGDGAFVNTWQVLQDTIWSDLSPIQQSDTLYPGTLTQDARFRLKSVNSCGIVYSNEVEVPVYPQVEAPVIASESSDTICWGAIAPSIFISTPSQGGDGVFVSTWQMLQGTAWVDIPSMQSIDTMHPGNLVQATRYRLKSDGICGTVYSNEVEIQVFPQLRAGVLSQVQPICFNTQAVLVFDTMPTSGSGAYHYQWQESTDGLIFTNIVDANTCSYTTPLLQSNHYYRTLIGDGCDTVLSNTIEVVTYAPFAAGSIVGSDTICYHTQPGLITIDSGFTGGSQPYSYQWFESADGVTFAAIAQEQNVSYQPNELITSTWYYLRATDRCGTQNTDTVRILVYDDLTAPHITTSTAAFICYDSIPDSLYLDTLPTGGNSQFTYQWMQDRGNGWENTGTNQIVYYPANLTTNTSFKVMATSMYGCGQVASNEHVINVYPRLNAGLLTNDTVCYNTGTIISFTQSPVGGGGEYTYQWQQSDDSQSFSMLSATSSQYNTQAQTIDRYYRVIVISAHGCSNDTTNVMHLTVLPEFVPGTIGGQNPICYNTRPATILLQQPATGDLAPYGYQWQSSNDSVFFVPDSGATNNSYRPNRLTADTYYRLQFNSGFGCSPVYSNVIKIQVWDSLTPAVIATNTTSPICFDSIPSSLFISHNPLGADGSFTHQWQRSIGGVWYNITQATDTIFQPSNLQSDATFRLLSTSTYGCGNAPSNELLVNVYDKIDAGSLADTMICNNTSATLHFSEGGTPSGGGGIYNYRWLVSTDSINFVPNSSAASPTFVTGNITNHRYYKVEVASGLGCSQDTTEVVKVHVLEPFVAGSIGGSDTICFDSIPAHKAITLTTPATGGLPSYHYQWESRGNGSTFTETGSTDTMPQLAPSALKRPTYYRLRISDSYNCGIVYTNSIYVHVWDSMEAAKIRVSSIDTICYDSIPDVVLVTTYPTGADGRFTYQWQQRDSLQGWHNCGAGFTGTAYQAGRLTIPTHYRLLATSTFGCGTLISDTAQIHVFKKIKSGSIYSDTTVVCYDRPMHLGFDQLPSEGGGRYRYTWQSSPDNVQYRTLDNANDTSYSTDSNLLSDTYFRAIVTSVWGKGCSADTTEPIHIMVHQPFVGGSITSHLDSVCYSYQPDYTIDSLTNCSGGDMPYSYQWQISVDGEHFSDAPHGTNGAYYKPDTLFSTAYYRLIYTSHYNCGTDTSNTHIIKVNPLPPDYDIIGPDTVCYTQYETYILPNASDAFSYEWSIPNGTGDVISLSPLNDSVEIYWKTANTEDTIDVEVTDNITGCYSHNYRPIRIRDQYAPTRTLVVRKPNSNILVCKEDRPSLYYKWGFTVKATGADSLIENSNRRYVLLPHQFDTLTYDYWVELSPEKTSPCYSRSYYYSCNDEEIEEPSSNSVNVPASALGTIPIKIVNPNEQQVYCEVYSIEGLRTFQKRLGPGVNIQYTIDGLHSDTQYIVRIVIGNEVFIRKTFVK